MDIVVWNMQQKEGNWRLLRDGEDLEADIHILCEAPRPGRDVRAIGVPWTVALKGNHIWSRAAWSMGRGQAV